MSITQKRTSKWFAMILVVVMVLSMVPSMAFAAELDNEHECISTTETAVDTSSVSHESLDSIQTPIFDTDLNTEAMAPLMASAVEDNLEIVDLGTSIGAISISGIYDTKHPDSTDPLGKMPLYIIKVPKTVVTLKLQFTRSYLITGADPMTNPRVSVNRKKLTKSTLYGTDGFYLANKEKLSQYITNSDSRCFFGVVSVRKGGRHETITVNGYLLVEWEKSEPADKSALKEAIANAPITGYYTENDRYNGREEDTITTKDGSFWAEFQTALANANKVKDNKYAVQNQVNDAVEVVNAAIAKLIPKTQVNPTALYETMQKKWFYWGDTVLESASNCPAVNKENTTDASWKGYQEALVSAQRMLDSLYQDGEPKESNKAENQNKIDEEIEAFVTALKACDNVDKERQTDYLADAKLGYNGINILANQLFNPRCLRKSEYTQDSWNAFVLARTEALAWYKSHSLLVKNIGDKEHKSYMKAYMTLSNACYGLVSSAETVKVTLDIVDSYAAKGKVTACDCTGSYNLTLSGGASLDDAFTEALGENYYSLFQEGITRKYFPGMIFTINGSVLYNAEAIQAGGGGGNIVPFGGRYCSEDCSKVKLNDGDQLVLTFVQFPTKNLITSTIWYPIMDSQDDYKDIYLEQNGKKVSAIEVEAGKSFHLTAKSQLALVPSYNNKESVLCDASVYISDCFASEAEARKAAAINNTEVITDKNGYFSHRIYAEGWYLLNVFDFTNAYGSLSTGSTVMIHVCESSNVSAVKTDLKSQLSEIYSEYDANFYTAEDWKRVCSFYETGKLQIDATSTCKEMGEAYELASKGIEKIQEKTINSTVDKISYFRKVLNRLPDDVSDLNHSVAHLFVESLNGDLGLIDAYESLTEYEKTLLTPMEINKYTKSMEKYNAGLDEGKFYHLKLNIKADSNEAKKAIEKMYGYLQQEYECFTTGHGQDKPAQKVGTFTSGQRNLGYKWEWNGLYDSGFWKETQSVDKSYPDRRIELLHDVDVPAYQILTKNEFSELKGENWLITAENYKENTEEYFHTFYNKEEQSQAEVGYYEVLHGYTVKICGKEYEIKNIEFIGVDDSIPYYEDSCGYYENGKIKSFRQLRRFMKSSNVFYMPYNDVTVNIIWGPVEGTAIDKIATELKVHYNTYKKAEYTTENWATLTATYNDGVTAIRSAEMIDAATLLKEAAMVAMAAVTKKPSETPSDIPSWDEENVFDSGEQVGTVEVLIENRTFKGGDFYGTIVNKKDYPLGKKDSMMTCVLRALKDKGYTWNGTGGDDADDYKISYLASLKKGKKSLGEFDGEPGSGWMGTLNDWFVNEGFATFTVKNRKLEDGDVIHVMFTQNLGEDLGGTWGNSDTSLKKLDISKGTLTPEFKKDVTDYVLMIPGENAMVDIEPTAANKNYLVKTFLNEKVTSNREGNAFYKRTETIPVRNGDVIYIGIGETAWASMNNQGDEARDYEATWYKIQVVGANGFDSVTKLIDNLCSARKIKLDSYKEDIVSVENARIAYNALSKENKAKVTNVAKLLDVEAKIKYYVAIDNVKELLAKVPNVRKIQKSNKAAVVAADKAYKALSKEQKMYITIRDVANYNKALQKLIDMGAFKGKSAPSIIKGSDAIPEVPVNGECVELNPKATISGSTATSSVTSNEMKDAIGTLKKEKSDALLIEPKIKGNVDKVVVKLPKSEMSTLSKESNADVVIKSEVGEISISNKALENIVGASGSMVTITAEKQDKNNLSEENKKIVGEHPVYNLTIEVGGKHITKFKGDVTVKLPYTPKANENTAKLTVYYIDDNGKVTEMAGAHYDEKSGSIVFKTDHFSTYAVVYDENKIAFTDVKASDWFYKSVQFAVKNGLFKGTTETTFGPNEKTTRAMLVTVLYRMAGDPAVSDASEFTDVKASQWYSNPVAWAAKNEIVSGYSDTMFGINDPITREQIASILYRYAKQKGYEVTASTELTGYTDQSKVSTWANDAMKWAVGSKIVNGRSATTLAPEGTATRAEVATMLMNFMNYIEK